MPVGAGSIRRAAKKAMELEEKVVTVEAAAQKVASSVLGGTDPQVMDMVLSMRDGTPISNKSQQLGKNERVEIFQDMPVHLL